MRKGFLNGPVAKKEEEETVSKEVKETGAVPKVKVEAAKPIKVETGKKRRRRTRSMGTSLSPSPGRGFFVPGFSKEGEKSMSLTELMDASKVNISTIGALYFTLPGDPSIQSHFMI